jgi:sigma-B regulation protein RsbU (phosphoserine phosphatase)
MSERSPSPSQPAKPIRFGLRFKIILGLTLFNLLGSAAFAWNHYRVEKEATIEGIRQKLSAAARALPDMLPDGYLDRAVARDAVGTEEYKRIMQRLSAYCDDVGLLYLYTYTFHNGVFRTTSSNATAEERATSSYAAYWDNYEEPLLQEAWDAGQPRFGETSEDDEWGHVYFLFSPQTTAAGTRYVAGADIAIKDLYRKLDASLRNSILIGVISFLVVFIFSFWIGTRMSRKIGQLADYTRELAAADFQPVEDLPLRRTIGRMPAQGHDEIAQLASSFIAMEQRLNDYLRELTETTATKERLHNELKIAGDIQLSMLPRSFKDIATPQARRHVDLAAGVKPAKEAGGDLYDFFFLDENHLCFLVGDVSDKGMPAALFMTVALSVLRARATVDYIECPQEILRQTNELLITQNSACQFVTLFLGILDIRTGRVVFSDGGHNHPFLKRACGIPEMLSFRGGIALGIVPGAEYTREELILEPGDVLYLYSDGVTDAVAVDDSFYGEDRLASMLAAVPPASPAAEWVESSMQSVFDFATGAPQADDITVMALRYLARAS